MWCPDVIGWDSWDWDVSWDKSQFPCKVSVITVFRMSDYVLVKTECPMEEVVVVAVIAVSCVVYVVCCLLSVVCCLLCIVCIVCVCVVGVRVCLCV